MKIKSIVIIILISVIGLAIIGGGVGTFLSNVEKGTEKIKHNEQLKDITNKISTELNQQIIKSDSIIKNQISEETKIQTDKKYCNPSYPDVCISAWPPDLDCNDIPYRNFKVLYPDQHKFDEDEDGIGCE